MDNIHVMETKGHNGNWDLELVFQRLVMKQETLFNVLIVYLESAHNVSCYVVGF